MTSVRRTSLIGAASTLAITMACTASPAFAAPPVKATADPVAISVEDRGQPLSPEQAALAKDLDTLISAVDPSTTTFDERSVSVDILDSVAGKSFRQEFLAAGGKVISRDGAVVNSSATPTLLRETNHSTAGITSVKAAAATGRIWQDVWGAHITLPSAVMDRLSTLLATGSAAAGAVAALLALHVEGFPLTSSGALASGAIAVGLIAASGVLQLCNINGKGAQLNYNWITWTCWPL